MTPSREMLRDSKPCTDGDFESVLHKGERQIKGYGDLSLTFRERNFILSLDRVARVSNLR